DPADGRALAQEGSRSDAGVIAGSLASVTRSAIHGERNRNEMTATQETEACGRFICSALRNGGIEWLCAMNSRTRLRCWSGRLEHWMRCFGDFLMDGRTETKAKGHLR